MTHVGATCYIIFITERPERGRNPNPRFSLSGATNRRPHGELLAGHAQVDETTKIDRLFPLRRLTEVIFTQKGAEPYKNYSRLYPPISVLRQEVLDFHEEHMEIRQVFNADGLRDQRQRGYSPYQIFAILRLISELLIIEDEHAISTILTTGVAAKHSFVKKIIAQSVRQNAEKYSKESVMAWVESQQGVSEGLQLLYSK